MNKISINLVVLNGERYIRSCLDSILAQSHNHQEIGVVILDNGSTDQTKNIIKEYESRFQSFGSFRLIESDHNYGMWGGQEHLLEHSTGEYLVAMAVDVILDKDFISESLKVMGSDSKIGALQAKTFQFNVSESERSHSLIDTCGFEIFRSRRIVNIGHGEKDSGQFNNRKEIFGVEGAVPVLRREALESIKVLSEIADHDLFWYAEDLDIAWRLNLKGWKQVFDPAVIAWHDRQTTKRKRNGILDFYKIRREIPLHKRRLEWRNIRFTILKNDYIINILKDLGKILPREIAMTLYLLIFEPQVLAEIPTFLRLLPRMLKKRHLILSGAQLKPHEIHMWFH
ncbi:glycosyltransferase family 2 protein [Candidatus Parcubacteria bacterium]|nr:glycosyltransferase family 2 protein [Candidatus Parcubacteria bacterium]